MTCEWEDRNSLCQLEAKYQITYGKDEGDMKKIVLCPECASWHWDLWLPKIRTGSVEWRKEPLPKKAVSG